MNNYFIKTNNILIFYLEIWKFKFYTVMSYSNIASQSCLLLETSLSSWKTKNSFTLEPFLESNKCEYEIR